MNSDEEIARLDTELKRHRREHPQQYAALHLTNTCFGGAVEAHWRKHGLNPTKKEIGGLSSVHQDERGKALLSLLKDPYLSEVVFVPGVDQLDVVALPIFDEG